MQWSQTNNTVDMQGEERRLSDLFMRDTPKESSQQGLFGSIYTLLFGEFVPFPSPLAAATRGAGTEHQVSFVRGASKCQEN